MSRCCVVCAFGMTIRVAKKATAYRSNDAAGKGRAMKSPCVYSHLVANDPPSFFVIVRARSI